MGAAHTDSADDQLGSRKAALFLRFFAGDIDVCLLYTSFMTFPTGQEIVQTYCSAKNGKAAMTGSVIAGLLSAAYAIVPAIIGLLAYTCIDGFAMGGAQQNALAEATIRFSPSIVAGLVLAAIVACLLYTSWTRIRNGIPGF